jgi:hypothetical protein
MVLKRGHFRNQIRNAWKVFNVVLEKNGEDQWSNRVRNEEVLHRVKEERNILHTIKRRKANWIGHILRRFCISV